MNVLKQVGHAISSHKTEILAGVGVVGILVGTTLACKETPKANDILEKHNDELTKITNAYEEQTSEMGAPIEYSKKDYTCDVIKLYLKTESNVFKTYAPAAACIGLGLGCLLGSHYILKKENAFLAAGLASTEQVFKEYRGRVADYVGLDKERELRYNILTKEIEEEIVNSETGEVTTEKKTIKEMDEQTLGMYSAIFDELNINYNKDSEKNRFFLLQQQRYLNERLKSKTTNFITLNEVYEALGFAKTTSGVYMGWVYDADDPYYSETEIDFGLTDISKRNVREFINGYEPAVLLDFNVQGNVYEILTWHNGFNSISTGDPIPR